MTFNPNIPTATQRISQSQAPIQTNFLTSDEIFDVDHVTFDDVMVSLRGYHRKVTFSAVLGSDPNFAAPISSLYTKGTPPQLYFQNGNLAANVAQLTGNLLTQASGQYTVVTPWGITFKFGTMAIVTSGVKIPFITNFTVGLGSIVQIRQGSGGGFQVSSLIANDGITIAGTNINGQTAYFLAWGT